MKKFVAIFGIVVSTSCTDTTTQCMCPCPCTVVTKDATPLIKADIAQTQSQIQTGTLAWSSSFENGYPGEFLSGYANNFVANGVPSATVKQAWATVSKTQWPNVFSGNFSYKGWVIAASTGYHRAYPVLHTDISTPLVNSWVVYLDIDQTKMASSDWIHFGTWGNNVDWNVHTMSVSKKLLHMANLDSSSYVGPQPQAAFPERKWVRLTVYLYYRPNGPGTVLVWQDGVKVLKGYVSRAGQNLQRAHWGMYTNGSLAFGAQYNDDIKIWKLAAPLTDLVKEPVIQ